jgi:ADP-L-glycero-D-manno-heptose 6-epimerase
LDRAPDIRFVPMPDDLKGNYQYFTEARMERLRAAGFRKNATTLEAGVASYVRDVLLNAEDAFA